MLFNVWYLHTTPLSSVKLKVNENGFDVDGIAEKKKKRY